MFLCRLAKGVWINLWCLCVCGGRGEESKIEHIAHYTEKLKKGILNQEAIPHQIKQLHITKKPNTSTEVTRSIFSIERGFLENKILRLNLKGMKWLDDWYHFV